MRGKPTYTIRKVVGLFLTRKTSDNDNSGSISNEQVQLLGDAHACAFIVEYLDRSLDFMNLLTNQDQFKSIADDAGSVQEALVTLHDRKSDLYNADEINRFDRAMASAVQQKLHDLLCKFDQYNYDTPAFSVDVTSKSMDEFELDLIPDNDAVEQIIKDEFGLEKLIF